ncbi:hypothetical protein [Psychrobacter sp. K31L]|uniref:hypothetical protein n=1 Tax=Psychrobacter sp. K31L TaxID=2820758 RepID=UPI001B33C1FF|nr:hypothetical protein [Psychrobacter sp. K31L]MBP3945163.1 hypothetical protein [Psychrobacter sp. K31L]
MNNLQPVKWSKIDLNDLDELTVTAYSALHEYLITELKTGKFELKKTRLSRPDKKSEFMSYFDTSKEARDWAWAHYQRSMQPYVKPSPTKVFELTYDCGDSYFTVFMTTDKQSAIDFMESVKDADQDFISSYGFDDDADELLVEQYDDNHPLKPYARKIFNSIHEDSFSEWARSYAGNSFVSQLSIIEHELREVTK